MAKYKRAGTLFPDSDDSEGEEDSFGGRNGLSKSDKGWEAGTGSNLILVGGLNINKDYADRYDKWRNKEELMKMKARYGTDNIDDLEQQQSDESSSSSEEEWTEDKEKAFFKTLSNLKKKDPKIYDPNVRFFTPEEGGEPNSSPKKKKNPASSSKQKKAEAKPFLLKDHERTMILEKGGLISDSEEEDSKQDKAPTTLSYYQELDSIRKGFSQALEGIESDDENEEQLLLKKGKAKTQEEVQQEDEDYRLWLKGELKRLDNGKLSKDEVKELSFLRSYWNDEKLDEGEKFLRDYILNRKYIEGEDRTLKSSSAVGAGEEDDEESSYNKIAHDSDEGGLSNDEQFEEQREEFEHKYNFRFEEPDPEFIKRFPRTIEDSLRREDESRKRQREAAKGRRKDAKERKREEVQRLKAYKRKEILEKLQQLQEVSGNPDLPLEDMDIDGDFDPEEYDAKMRKVFNDQYYTDSAGVDEEKPVFPFDPEIDDEADWKEWVPSENEDDEVADSEIAETSSSPSKTTKKPKKAKSEKVRVRENRIVPPNAASSSKFSLAEELIEISKGRKSNKKSKSNIFLEALEKNKPKFDPSLHKSFDQYFKEYYALDFEDLIGDLPCRFKYRKVAPNDFGLSTKEILKAEDKELNQWASLKKTYQYRAEEEEKYEAHAYKKKAENEGLKKRVLLSVYQPTLEGDDNELEEDDDESTENATLNIDNQLNGGSSEISKPKKKKKKKDKKKKPKAETTDEVELSQEIKTEIEETDDIDANEAVIPAKKHKTKNVCTVEDLSEVKQEPVEESEGTMSMLPEHIQEPGESEPSTPKLSKRQKKNRSKKQTPSDPQPNGNAMPPKSQNSNQRTDSNKKKKKDNFNNKGSKFNSSNINGSGVNVNKRKAEVGIEDERLKAYGINPKKHKKWVKYGGNNNQD